MWVFKKLSFPKRILLFMENERVNEEASRHKGKFFLFRITYLFCLAK